MSRSTGPIEQIRLDPKAEAGRPDRGHTLVACAGIARSRSDAPVRSRSSSMTSFDDYLASVPEPQKSELERIRQLVRSAVPEAEEATSYGMPAFKYNQRPLLGFKASKNHLSVFPFSPEAVDAAREALAGFDLSKGTVRFTVEQPLPDAALEQLLRHRLREIERA
jgi:uncharacterized protein YdhG (YjbR/CyaY superfamily)